MTSGQDSTEYDGCEFHTRTEAQWAVFFETYQTTWYYEPEGWPTGNEEHYRPQFWLIEREAYLEVQRPSDRRERHPMPHFEPEIEEPTVYLSMAGIPTEEQLSTVGWWDPRCRYGIMRLTPGYAWDALFPPTSPDVLAALQAARTETFEKPTAPEPRQPGQYRIGDMARDTERR